MLALLQTLPTNSTGNVPEYFFAMLVDEQDFIGVHVGNIDKRIQTVQNQAETRFILLQCPLTHHQSIGHIMESPGQGTKLIGSVSLRVARP